MSKSEKSSEEKYTFSADIQKKIVAMLLRDELALEDSIRLIKPNYFDNPILKDLTRLIIGFYKKYFRPPTEDELTEELDVFLGKEKERNKNFPIDEYCDVCEEVLTFSRKGDFDYVRDRARDFAQHQAVKRAVLEAGEKLGKKDYKAIQDSISAAVRAGEEGEIELKLTPLDTIAPEKSSFGSIESPKENYRS